jgi:hypothetical protein
MPERFDLDQRRFFLYGGFDLCQRSKLRTFGACVRHCN